MVDAGIVRLGFAGGVLVGGLLSLSLALRLASRGLFGRSGAARLPRRLPSVERVLLLLLVCGLVQYGATKGTGGGSPARSPAAAAGAVAYAGGKGEGAGGEGVSSKEQVVSAEFSSSVVAADGTQQDIAHHTYSLLLPPYSLSDEDISRGYRLVSVVTNEAHSYAMPPDARLVGTWHLTDAYDAVVKVGLDVWAFGRLDVGGLGRGEMFSFPLGGQVVTSLWAHVWGRARPQLWNASNELVAVGAPMCARRGVSRLWTAATPSNTVLLTWQDFFFKGVSSKEQVVSAEGSSEEVVSSKEKGVSAKSSSSVVTGDGTQQDVDHHTYSLLPTPYSFSPISAQLELSRDGSFVARSNSVARVYRRVDPDDWDGDGIPNREDDDPRVAADEPRFGPRQSLPPGAHTNNYCWVDLAVRDADALVSFAGDAPSDLPDPSFVARAGETNRVTLLIGKRYTIHSLLPVEVVGTSDPEVEVGADEAGRTTVRWPVRCEYVDAALPPSPRAAGRRVSAAGRGGAMPRVLPARLQGGVFSWPGRFCCWEAAPDGTPVFACGGACGCGGCSTGEMTFTLEGCAFSFGGWSCSCSHVPPARPGDEDDDEEPNPLPGASARFSKRVILFEDEYEDAPGVTVPWRSTETELDCRASGGPNGGRVRIEARGVDGLVPYGGLPLPFERELEPFEEVAFKNTYRAVRPSGGEGEIVVTATFEENGTGAAWTSEDRATAVRLKFEPVAPAPANKSTGRHKYGVGEEVGCTQSPNLPQVRWLLKAGEMDADASQYKCPLYAVQEPFIATCGGAEFTPAVSVVPPQTVSVRDPWWDDFDAPIGEAGSIVMLLPLYIGPMDVSFANIAVEEVPHEDHPNGGDAQSGYFARRDLALWWHHTRENGAGVWRNVDAGTHRMGGDSAYDQAGITETLSRVNLSGLFVDDPDCRWSYGRIVMATPFGWNKKNTQGEARPCKMFEESVQAILELQENGTFRVEKLGNTILRHVSGEVFLNGVRQR